MREVLNIYKYLKGGVKRMTPGSFQWCPVAGQEAICKNRNTGNSIWTWGKISLLWGWQSNGTGCPERLWSLLLWRYSKAACTLSCATYRREPVLAGDWAWWSQSSLPISVILWFYDFISDLYFSTSHYGRVPNTQCLHKAITVSSGDKQIKTNLGIDTWSLEKGKSC